MDARGRDGNTSSRVLACSCALVLAFACARTRDQWLAELDSPDPFVRALAAIGMSVETPAQAAPALAVLLQTIDRKDLALEREAARALVHIGPHHVPALLESLLEEPLLSQDRRAAIGNALTAAGPAASRPIVRCLRQGGSHLVGDLGDVLLRIGPDAVPDIVEMLEQDPDVRLRNFAAFLLARMGPSAVSGRDALRAATAASDPGLREMAQQALASIEGRPWHVPRPAGNGHRAQER